MQITPSKSDRAFKGYGATSMGIQRTAVAPSSTLSASVPLLESDLTCARMNNATMHHGTCLRRQARNLDIITLHKWDIASRLLCVPHGECHQCPQGQTLQAMYSDEWAELIGKKGRTPWNPHKAPRKKKGATAYTFHYQSAALSPNNQRVLADLSQSAEQLAALEEAV
jgi:hypothetical protein